MKLLIPNLSRDYKVFSGTQRIIKLCAWSPLVKTISPFPVFPVAPKLGTYQYFSILWMFEITQMQHSMIDLDEETSHTTHIQACKFEQYRSMGPSTIIFFVDNSSYYSRF